MPSLLWDSIFDCTDFLCLIIVINNFKKSTFIKNFCIWNIIANTCNILTSRIDMRKIKHWQNRRKQIYIDSIIKNNPSNERVFFSKWKSHIRKWWIGFSSTRNLRKTSSKQKRRMLFFDKKKWTCRITARRDADLSNDFFVFFFWKKWWFHTFKKSIKRCFFWMWIVKSKFLLCKWYHLALFVLKPFFWKWRWSRFLISSKLYIITLLKKWWRHTIIIIKI